MGVVSPIQAELLPILCQNFQIFVAMATGVGLAQIFTSTVKFIDPDNPLKVAVMGVVSPIPADLLPICQNFQIFVAMATGVRRAQISIAQLNSPTPITPS